jgi:hypothetical protein
MTRRNLFALVHRTRLAVAVVLLLSSSCHRPAGPGGDPGDTGLLNCAVQSVVDHWPTVLPLVNKCLVNQSVDVVTCLLGAIDPAVGITEGIIACVTRSSAASYHDAANHGDETAARAAARADLFLHRYKFAPGGP